MQLITGAWIAAAVLVGACSMDSPAAPSNAPPTTDSSPPPPGSETSSSARYRVTFQAAWSRATHPRDFPSSPHFSPLIGGTHNASVRFWAGGSPASAGIKDMSERGRTTPLDQEIGAAIAAGTAEFVFVGGDVPRSPGAVSLDFAISQAHPLVTLVSMIAPSPDWFVGVSALPLFENGQWAAERQVDLVPWDAGTDSGTTFTSGDRPTTPPAAISRIVTSPLSPDGRVTPLGTFTFTRIGG